MGIKTDVVTSFAITMPSGWKTYPGKLPANYADDHPLMQPQALAGLDSSLQAVHCKKDAKACAQQLGDVSTNLKNFSLELSSMAAKQKDNDACATSLTATSQKASSASAFYHKMQAAALQGHLDLDSAMSASEELTSMKASSAKLPKICNY